MPPEKMMTRMNLCFGTFFACSQEVMVVMGIPRGLQQQM